VLGGDELRAVEVPGGHPVRRHQHQGEARHAGQLDGTDPVDAVRDGEQWQHSAARRAGVGQLFPRPVHHERCRAGADVRRAPRAARDPVASSDDVGELRPPPVRVVELARRQLVAQRQDLRRRAGRPADDDGAHAAMSTAWTGSSRGAAAIERI
jgi:hypothetical protein